MFGGAQKKISTTRERISFCLFERPQSDWKLANSLLGMQEGVPTVITMGGGYSRPIDNTVEAHADVYRAAAQMYPAQ